MFLYVLTDYLTSFFATLIMQKFLIFADNKEEHEIGFDMYKVILLVSLLAALVINQLSFLNIMIETILLTTGGVLCSEKWTSCLQRRFGM